MSGCRARELPFVGRGGRSERRTRLQPVHATVRPDAPLRKSPEAQLVAGIGPGPLHLVSGAGQRSPTWNHSFSSQALALVPGVTGRASMRRLWVTVRESGRRVLPVLLAMLACGLPFAVLLSSQLRIYCDEQEVCSLPVQVGAWLLVPLVIAWSAAVLVLVVLAARLMLTRRRRRSSD